MGLAIAEVLEKCLAVPDFMKDEGSGSFRQRLRVGVE